MSVSIALGHIRLSAVLRAISHIPLVIFGLGLSLGVALPALSQSRDSSLHLPPPAVVAGLPSAVPLDWSRSAVVENCLATFKRVVVSVAFPLERDTLRDTLQRHNPWVPLPPAAIAVGRQCLSHFQVAELPASALPSALRLAVGVNADTVVQAIVTRQLSQVHGPAARAAVLDSVVEVLLTNDWGKAGERVTQAHVQLARTYIAQLDRLGEMALRKRLAVRFKLYERSRDDSGVDTMLAIVREMKQLARDSVGADPEWKHFYATQEINELGLMYVKTLADTDLTKIKAAALQLGDTLASLGTPAVPVHCDFGYPMPSGSASHSSTLTVPATGQISVMLFVTGRSDVFTDLGVDLRRLHHTFPDVAVTVVTWTTGNFGPQALYDHPDQEAMRLHQYYADSLQLPAAVCVIKSAFRTVSDGHIVSLPSPIREMYRIEEGDTPQMFVVDPRGIVVNDPNTTNGSDRERPFDDDLLDFIRRLHAKFATGSSTGSSIVTRHN